MNESQVLLERRVPRDWDGIDAIREEVARSMAAPADQDAREAMGMIAAELLENAVKFGLARPEGIGLALTREGPDVVLVVENAVDPGSPDLKSLLDRVAWCAGFATAEAAYMAALADVYAQPSARGGLGIVRIVYEGGCRVSCDTTRPGLVRVSARRPLAASAGGAS
jgi:hypothetical protein